MEKSYAHFCRVWKNKEQRTWQQRSTASGKKPTGLYFRALYQCSNEILNGLGKMYASGAEFTENIDKAAGAGTAAFVAEAIEIYTAR